MKRALLFAPLAFVSMPVLARDWPATAGWDIAEGNNFCFMMRNYEGPGDTQLLLAMATDGRLLIQLSNSGWSIVEKQPYKVFVEFDDQTFEVVIRGKDNAGKMGLAANFSGQFVHDFEKSLMKSSSLHFYLDTTPGDTFNYDNPTVLDKLKLDGSAAAWSVVTRCAKIKIDEEIAARAKEDAYERRWQSIPADPFAKSKD